MLVINEYEKTENFISDKLIGAQLDSFKVSSMTLNMNFFGDTKEVNVHGDRKHGLNSYWLCASADVNLTDGQNIHQNRSEVIAHLYNLIGQEVSSVEIEAGGALSLCLGGKMITMSADDDVNLEGSWSLTPETPDVYDEHTWFASLEGPKLSGGPKLVLKDI